MKFPEDMEITVPNLLRFIFQYSTPSVDDPSELGPKQCLQNQDPPEQGKVSHLENEIQRLRAEIGALRQVQDNLAVQISEARKDEHKLKIQKQTLEENNQALLLHKNHLQALYEYQTKQLGEIAEKLEELADASENLLTENALLKLLVASMEETLRNNKADNNEYQASSDETRPVLDDVQRQVLEKETLEGSNLEGTVTSEHINENRTG